MTSIPTTITACIVLYKQDLIVFENAINAFKCAAKNACKILEADFELIIVDNNSGKEFINAVEGLLQSIDSAPVKFKFIKNNVNSGYSGGNNLPLDELKSDYHIVMNPDVYVHEDAFIEALKYMQSHKQVGLLTPAIYGLDAKQVYLCKKNPTILDMFLRSFAPFVIKKYFKDRMDAFEMRECDYSKEIIDVPFPSGCFILFRTKIFKDLNGFDQRFFLYMEDADIGRRALQLTHSAYVPSVKITHLWARGSHNNFRLMLETIKSVIIYWRKWGGLF